MNIRGPRDEWFAIDRELAQPQQDLLAHFAVENDLPLELVERWSAQYLRRFMLDNRELLMRSVGDLAWSTDSEVAEGAIELAGRLRENLYGEDSE